MTSLLSPPRSGSGQDHTGLSTQSDLSPGAWFVLEPSKPQIGRSAPSARTFVFDRSRAVGSVPSIQMYSALYATSSLLIVRAGCESCGHSDWRCRGGHRRPVGVGERELPGPQFQINCRNVNAV